MQLNTIHNIDALSGLLKIPPGSINTCITSPPYFGLRDYGHEAQIGLEETPEQYVAQLVAIFREVRRVLHDDGVLWLNLGDSYANDGKWGGHTGGKHVKSLHASPIGRNKKYTGLKSKDLIGIPWMVAFALRADGWYLRQDIIWHKPNPMPESVTDRCTKAHEYIFLLSKSERYWYDSEAIAEPKAQSTIKDNRGNTNGKRRNRNYPGYASNGGTNLGGSTGTRNRRSVWTIPTKPFSEAHFATFPEDLVAPCILAGCPQQGIVIDPFMGAGTTALVASKLNRQFIGFEINPHYCAIAQNRLQKQLGLFNPYTPA